MRKEAGMAEKTCGLKLHDSLLVAYDGSKFSNKALDQGIAMAEACGSMLFIVHVVDINEEYLALSPGLSEKMEAEAARTLEAAEDKVKKAGIKCEAILAYGSQPYRPIVDEAAKRKVSLIIMGSHGRSGLKKVLMGSVSQRVIGHAPCSVLIVPG